MKNSSKKSKQIEFEVAKSKKLSKAEMKKRSEMQGAKSTENEVAECYFDGFSITVVLERDDCLGKTRPVQ